MKDEGFDFLAVLVTLDPHFMEEGLDGLGLLRRSDHSSGILGLGVDGLDGLGVDDLGVDLGVDVDGRHSRSTYL